MIVYVQVASAELDGQRWYTVAAGPNLRLADWLARALEVEGQRTARAIPHDELLKTVRVPAQGERPDRLNVNTWIGAT